MKVSRVGSEDRRTLNRKKSEEIYFLSSQNEVFCEVGKKRFEIIEFFLC